MLLLIKLLHFCALCLKVAATIYRCCCHALPDWWGDLFSIVERGDGILTDEFWFLVPLVFEDVV